MKSGGRGTRTRSAMLNFVGVRMQIRKATTEDIEALGRFYDNEVSWMDAHGCNYPRWTYLGYPTTSTVEWTIGEGTQFICTEGEEILGAFMLNTDPLGPYEKVPWSKVLQRGEYMVIHMLSTSHEHFGEGLGKAMTEYCIALAKSLGFKGIRLDVVPGNIPAMRLYESCGFRYVGDCDLEKGVEKIPIFSLFELDF